MNENNENKKGYIENRKWGSFEILDTGKKYKVKRLTINSSKALSLQYHLKRDEHWTVVAGTADVIYGEKEMQLEENEGILIKREMRHKIRNKTDKSLIIIEVQYGDYLGEDDIVRLDA